ncbi:hypothetical protein NE579_08170 [Intestinimonas massiliensis]|uniref:Uncharacterized protein n=1 Tax=Intestinimonas massiliensis (ex Afouda et al. 2020) TaxID=1673721 RepID=A0AAW5JNM0_9FIRM|nr:hypothetical protein [Intestinimonas massiliensis (ex Afouda et al. 2020)]MCQ4770437.1 hypothetical protein [Intestinimonas massiliensis (ex Afouda et al. 2020)]
MNALKWRILGRVLGGICIIAATVTSLCYVNMLSAPLPKALFILGVILFVVTEISMAVSAWKHLKK